MITNEPHSTKNIQETCSRDESEEINYTNLTNNTEECYIRLKRPIGYTAHQKQQLKVLLEYLIDH